MIKDMKEIELRRYLGGEGREYGCNAVTSVGGGNVNCCKTTEEEPKVICFCFTF